MRGKEESQRVLYLINLESVVPLKHPIRQVKKMCFEVFKKMDVEIAGKHLSKSLKTT